MNLIPSEKSIKELLELYELEEVLELSNVSASEALVFLIQEGIVELPEEIRQPTYSIEKWDDLEIEPNEDE